MSLGLVSDFPDSQSHRKALKQHGSIFMAKDSYSVQSSFISIGRASCLLDFLTGSRVTDAKTLSAFRSLFTGREDRRKLTIITWWGSAIIP